MDKKMIFFEAKDGAAKVDVLLENGTVWLSMEQMCELLGENELIIGGLLTSIYAEGELREADTIRRNADGKSYYSIDVVLSIGFRVRSHKGQQFRVWAIQQLKDKMLRP